MRWLTTLIAIIAFAEQNSLLGQGPTMQWAAQNGASGGDWGSSLAIDPSGNLISTGTFVGQVDFNPGSATYNLGTLNSTVNEVYVQKLDNLGQFIWGRSFGTGIAVGYGVESDASGAVYVVGGFNSSCDFDPGPGTHYVSAISGSDIFVLKLDAQGNFLWVRTYNSSGASGDAAMSIARGSQNNMLISGTLYGSCDFDPGPGVAMVTYNDSLNENVFLLCLDTAGQYVWAAGFGGHGWDETNDVECDRFGNTYLSGMFTDTVDFDPGPGVWNLISQSGNQNMFALKLDPFGNLIYADAFYSTSFSYGLSVTCSQWGESIITGNFYGSVDFDPSAGTNLITAAGMSDAFVVKLDAIGNLLWVKTLGTNNNELGRTVTTDLAGNIYIAGDFCNTMDFDPGPGVHNMTSVTPALDIFIEKLDSAGNFVWSAGLGSTYSDYCFSIKTDSLNSVFTTGRFSGAADFDPNAGTHFLTANQTDAFVQKYVQCSSDTTFLTITACNSYTLNNQTYTSGGTYDQLQTNINGCTTSIQLDLTINTVDATITNTDPTLTANAIGATYQWINCENTLPIVGETSQSYTPTLNGTYAVIVTQNNCSDTSACATVLNLGEQNSTQLPLMLITNNSGQGMLNILCRQSSQVVISDALGRQIFSLNPETGTPATVYIESPGLYFVTMLADDGQMITKRIMVTR